MAAAGASQVGARSLLGKGGSTASKVIFWVLPPHTVTVYNRATIKVVICLYYEYYPTVTPKLSSCCVANFRHAVVELTMTL